MKRYVVGDIHGCCDELESLLSEVLSGVEVVHG